MRKILNNQIRELNRLIENKNQNEDYRFVSRGSEDWKDIQDEFEQELTFEDQS